MTLQGRTQTGYTAINRINRMETAYFVFLRSHASVATNNKLKRRVKIDKTSKRENNLLTSVVW